VTTEPDQILSEFIDAWNAGERPDVHAHLARAAPEHREELAAEIGRFAEIAPEPAYSPETLALMREEADALARLPSLLARARERARVSVTELGGTLARALSLSDERKATAYLEQLESGSLDPRGVSRRVLHALARALEVVPAQLEAAADRTAWRPAPVARAAAVWRAEPEAAASERADLETLARAMAVPAPEPWDEVDELFRGGR
jgi:hypothetical protein